MGKTHKTHKKEVRRLSQYHIVSWKTHSQDKYWPKIIQVIVRLLLWLSLLLSHSTLKFVEGYTAIIYINPLSSPLTSPFDYIHEGITLEEQDAWVQLHVYPLKRMETQTPQHHCPRDCAHRSLCGNGFGRRKRKHILYHSLEPAWTHISKSFFLIYPSTGTKGRFPDSG